MRVAANITFVIVLALLVGSFFAFVWAAMGN
nr:MAG TPA: hypothetical protein [Caudoviricetes sp.]